MKRFNKRVLNNGLRIVTIPRPENLATTVLALVEAGSKYEKKEVNGISHFLEHMAFKGTKKRPTSIEIASELDRLGAAFNAFTSHEYTGYYAKVKKQESEKALELISDLYLNPIFDKKEIEKEKGVIIEEYNMYEDMPQRKISDDFMSLLYGDQPVGRKILGEKDLVRKMTREDFIKYRGQHYLPQSTTIVISGAFDEKKAITQIKESFSDVLTGDKVDKPKVQESQKEPRVLVTHKDSDQTHLILGVRAFDLFDNRKYALQVLSDILGGGMSSRLFQKIREEMGAAYYTYCSTDLYTDHGYLAAAVGADHSRIEAVIKVILDEFNRVKNKEVSKDELSRSKSHLTGNLLLGLETSDSLALYYGSQEILKKEITDPDELVKKINAVTTQEIQQVANHIFQNKGLNLAIIGPYKEDQGFRDCLAIG